jgi:hypothetical protein
VGGDVSIDNDVLVVTLFISRPALTAQPFGDGGAHMGSACVCVFMG